MATTANSPYTTDVANMSIGKLDGGNAFHAAQVKPDWREKLTFKYKQYTLTYLMDKINKVSYSQNKTINWSEIGRTRTSQDVSSVTLNGGGATASVTVSTTTQYFIVRDVVVTYSGKLGQVDSVTIGGSQVLVLSPVDGVDFTTDDFNAGTGKLGHVGNLQEECYVIPSTRLHNSSNYSNGFSKHHLEKSYCDDTMGEPSWIAAPNGKKYSYYTDQFIQRKEHLRDTELAILMGQAADGTTLASGATMAKGVLTYVTEGGVRSTISAAPTEDDIIDQAALMTVNSDTDHYLVLAGNNYMKGATKALKNYHEDGAQFYGKFGMKPNEVGLNFQHYRFNNSTFNFVNYNVFNDPATLGVVNDPDYSNTALFLSLGSNDEGQSLIEVVYRKSMQGKPYKLFYSYSAGQLDHPQSSKMGGMRTTETACFSEGFRTDVSVIVRGLNCHGIQQG